MHQLDKNLNDFVSVRFGLFNTMLKMFEPFQPRVELRTTSNVDAQLKWNHGAFDFDYLFDEALVETNVRSLSAISITCHIILCLNSMLS